MSHPTAAAKPRKQSPFDRGNVIIKVAGQELLVGPRRGGPAPTYENLIAMAMRTFLAKGFSVRVRKSSPSPASVSSSLLQDIILGVLRGYGLNATDSIRALREVAEEMVLATPLQPNPSDLAGIQADNDLLETEGGLVSAQKLAGKLSVTKATVNNWKHKGLLISVPRGDGRRVKYPAWQVHNGQLLPNLSKILVEIDRAAGSSLGKVRFFLTRTRALRGASPLELLRKGDPKSLARIQRFAKEFGGGDSRPT